MGKTELYARLQRQTRETMLKAGKELEEEFRQRLLELEKEIVHQLIKQPKTEFEAWNLLQVWKSIEDSIGRWKKEAWLPTVEKHIKKTFREAEKQALKVLEELLGKEELQKEPPFNLLPEESLKFVLKFPFHFAGKFADDLKEQIREKLFTGIAMGKSYWDIAREIDLLGIPTVKPFKNSWERAQTIARTEIARAYHMGTLTTYQRLGVEEIKIICGSSPCNLCLSHCGTVKPISYADYVLKHPNCTCTYVAAKWKGKVLEERDYKESRFLTRQKETALREAKGFLRKWERVFSKPLTKEQMIEEFKKFFPSEREFKRHLRRHAIPEAVKPYLEKVLKKTFDKISYKEIEALFPKEFNEDWAFQYLKDTFRALAHPSFVFREFPLQPPKGVRLPRVTIYSGYKKWFAITLSGRKLLSSQQLDRKEFKSLTEWKEHRKKLLKGRFVEVGVDEELREIALRLRRRYRELTGED